MSARVTSLWGRGQGGAQARAVDEKNEAALPGQGREGLQLGQGVDGADLGGVGQVQQPGPGHVGEVGVGGQRALDVGGGELAVHRGHGDQLVPGGLDGTGLAPHDVARLGGDDGLVRAQAGRDRNQVGQGAAGHKVDVALKAGAQAGLDAGDGLGGEGVGAVGGLLYEVGFDQGAQDLGVGAFAVVVQKAVGGRHALWG